MKHIVRDATVNDAAAIAAIYAPFVLQSATSFEEVAPSADDMAARISTGLVSYAYLVAELAGEVIGYAYASQYRPRTAYRFTCEVSVYLAPHAQGKGVAGDLYQRLFSQLKSRGMKTMIAVVTTPNPNSDRFHAALGFEKIGTLRDVGQKFGTWHGTTFYQKHLFP